MGSKSGATTAADTGGKKKEGEAVKAKKISEEGIELSISSV